MRFERYILYKSVDDGILPLAVIGGALGTLDIQYRKKSPVCN